MPPLAGDAGGATTPPMEPTAVPWQPETLSNLLGELLDAAEQNRVGAFVAKCEEAKLLPALIKEIERDASFPKTAKVLLKQSLPRVAAKWLNKSGVSAEFQDELACVTAVLLIVQHDRKLTEKLDELIASQKPKETPKHPKTQTPNELVLP